MQLRQQYRDWGVWSRHIIRSRYLGIYARTPELIWNMGQELEAPYWNGAKNLISTTVYGIACKFDAPTDMKELHIQKSSDLPNDNLIHIWAPYRLNMEPPYSIWSCNRTIPELNIASQLSSPLYYGRIKCFRPFSRAHKKLQ